MKVVTLTRSVVLLKRVGLILKHSHLDAQLSTKNIFCHYPGKITAGSVTCTKEVF